MPQVTVEVSLPIGRSMNDAIAEALIAACKAMDIHVLEQHTNPCQPMVPHAGPDGKVEMVPSPNDATVDRILVTTWGTV